MSRLEIQEAIIDKLDQVDNSMLLAVQSLLETYVENHQSSEQREDFGTNSDGTPTTKDAFLAKAEAINERMENGAGNTAEEVFKKTEAWLKNTK